jgi:DNA polymerase-3 subunit delta'
MCKDKCGCGKCNGCATVKSGANPDIIYVDKGDKASVSVERIREAISEVYVRPIISDKKVIVIKDAHLMTKGAQNALLKAIEEPPSYVVFFLLCDTKSPILQTILSRVSSIDIPPRSTDVLKSIMPNAEDFMYRYSEGNIGKLIKLSEDEQFKSIRDSSVKISMSLLSDKEYEIYSFDDLFENREITLMIYDLITVFLRDVLLIKNNLEGLIINKDKIDDIKAFSASVTSKSVTKLIEIVTNASIELGKSGNLNMSRQAMLIKCREVIHD